MTVGPIPKRFYTEDTEHTEDHSWTEVEKQWEEAAPEPSDGGFALAFGAILLIVIGVHAYKVFTK